MDTTANPQPRRRQHGRSKVLTALLSDPKSHRDHSRLEAMRLPAGGGYRVFRKALPK